MRRFFVLFIVFLIPLQFLDEAFDDLAASAIASGTQLAATLSDAPPEKRCDKSSGTCDASSSPQAHADLADSVVVPARQPTLASAPSMAAVATYYIFPLRVFPIFDPPRA